METEKAYKHFEKGFNFIENNIGKLIHQSTTVPKITRSIPSSSPGTDYMPFNLATWKLKLEIISCTAAKVMERQPLQCGRAHSH